MRILGTVASSSREVPNAPTIGTATNVGTGRAYNNGAATVTFTAPTVDGGFPILDYTVTSSPGGFTTTGASSPLTVTGLQSGVAYTFTVTARTAIGTGPASAASNSITATTIPQTPTITSATRSSNTAVSIAFTGATGGSALTAVTATSSPSVSITSSGTSSPMTATATYASGTSYTFTITATNANGTSSASSASSAVTPFPVATIGSWAAATSYPIANNIYGEARSVGASLAASGGGGMGPDGQSAFSYSYNGSSWSNLASWGDGKLFPNIAGDKTTSTAQVLGGYFVAGEAAYTDNTTREWNTANAGWTPLGVSLPNNCWVASAIAWPSNVWSVTQGNQGTGTYFRTGTGSFSTGTSTPVSGSSRGHYAYSLGYSYIQNGSGMYSQTSAGGAYTVATNPAGISGNGAWLKFNVANNALFYLDTSTGAPYAVYRYNSNQTSTLMTSPVVTSWGNSMIASAGSSIFVVGGRISGNNTGTNYQATVS
jgi:hypothetical protein